MLTSFSLSSLLCTTESLPLRIFFFLFLFGRLKIKAMSGLHESNYAFHMRVRSIQWTHPYFFLLDGHSIQETQCHSRDVLYLNRCSGFGINLAIPCCSPAIRQSRFPQSFPRGWSVCFPPPFFSFYATVSSPINRSKRKKKSYQVLANPLYVYKVLWIQSS